MLPNVFEVAGNYISMETHSDQVAHPLCSQDPVWFSHNSKCELYLTPCDSFFQLPPAIRHINPVSSNLVFLEPVISSFWCFFVCTIGKIVTNQEKLVPLKDSQVELHLLMNCLGVCKISYLLHTLPFCLEDWNLRDSVHSAVPAFGGFCNSVHTLV